MTNRTEWTITQSAMWTAVHVSTGAVLVARTQVALMSKINEWEKA